MIGDWREGWGQGDFPFFIVQLANYMARRDAPSESNWAALREAQAMTAANDPKVGLAVLLPSMLFVAAIYWLGIYLAAALFIAGFMLWQGAGRLYTLLLVSTGVPVVLFLLFEKWFLVPLPKGPLEAWLGL
jgi:hypothetical protein